MPLDSSFVVQDVGEEYQRSQRLCLEFAKHPPYNHVVPIAIQDIAPQYHARYSIDSV